MSSPCFVPCKKKQNIRVATLFRNKVLEFFHRWEWLHSFSEVNDTLILKLALKSVDKKLPKILKQMTQQVFP